MVDLDDEVTIESSVHSSAHTFTSAHKPSLSSAQISSPSKALDVGAVANSCTRETEMEEHTEDFDDSLDAATAEIEEALLLERCETTAVEISAILDAADGNKASSLDDPQLRILMDPFHFFQRIYLSKKHGATRAFLRALSDAISVVNLDDKHLVSIRLAKAMMTFDEATRSPAHAKYIWKRVRRTIPPPSILEPLVREVFEAFGSLLDAKTKQPLFNKAALLVTKRCLELVRKGQLSDPVGIELYTDLGPCRGPDETADDGVRLYSCRRGTNGLEGGIHRNLRARFAKSGVTPRHANARLLDYVLGHNLTNSAVALLAVELLRTSRRPLSLVPALSNVSPLAYRKGIEVTRWVGRLDWVNFSSELSRTKHPILIDGAHNPSAAEQLHQYLHTLAEDSAPTTLITAISAPRPPTVLLEPLLRPRGSIRKVVCVSFSRPDGMSWIEPTPPEEMRELLLRDPAFEHVQEVQVFGEVEQALKSLGEADRVVVAGSLYLAADVYRLIRRGREGAAEAEADA
ncbi:hypothetical protein MVLG_07211 [Microbotryum lychnidis-dioicae p1A1 Lamole]|uniref:Mur ligase C-terminal domain-containing protein n=1 Tax=Microbotryum lychnidis-dioicae (strain p1A1 Lamole / MvSl-1064) TaxID=683840 RepID=U5HJN1_USTV1|nr:hypothetical protein MVLG_07211 [Microbotryum lychnidis-dioicae p1A1 Lamole]|eukprot:KDE02219.1 hypothetical protein MVLG_07211 [Microbotryum lychnidis-dioicae p1A1 Lamole]